MEGEGGLFAVEEDLGEALQLHVGVEVGQAAFCGVQEEEDVGLGDVQQAGDGFAAAVWGLLGGLVQVGLGQGLQVLNTETLTQMILPQFLQ